MSSNNYTCIRCDQPVGPGQFYLRVEYIPKDIQDLINQPEADDAGSWLAHTPYKMHVDCAPRKRHD